MGTYDLYVDFRGWRFFEPFYCMACARRVEPRQFAFSRSCGACDVSNSRTAILRFGKCFSGRREKLPDHGSHRAHLKDDTVFIDVNSDECRELIRNVPLLRPSEQTVPPRPLQPRRAPGSPR